MIIRPFNSVFFLLMALIAAGIVGFTLGFRNKSDKAKTVLITSICAVNIVLFFVYKWFLSVDEEFLIAAELEKFNWWAELPLQLCNINMFLIAAGAITKKKSLLGFSFFTAPLGALMALITPEPTFCDYSLFMPRILGYYLTHAIIVMSGLLIVTLGFYRPTFRTLPGVFAMFVSIAACIHVVNIILRSTVCPKANYFYTFDSAGVGILGMFWDWIPCPFLYLLPGLAMLAVYMVVICSAFLLYDKLSEKRALRKKEPAAG